MGSETEQRTRVTTALSKVLSAKGRTSTDAWVKVIGTTARSSRFRT